MEGPVRIALLCWKTSWCLRDLQKRRGQDASQEATIWPRTPADRPGLAAEVRTERSLGGMLHGKRERGQESDAAGSCKGHMSTFYSKVDSKTLKAVKHKCNMICMSRGLFRVL